MEKTPVQFVDCGEYTIRVPQNKPLIVSGGVGEDLEFEQTLVKAYHGRVFCFDFTKKSKRYFDLERRKKMLYIERAISANKEIEVFVIPDSIPVCSTSEFESHTNYQTGLEKVKVRAVTLRDIVETFGHIDILKLDIEGSEYGILKSMDIYMAMYVDQICGEFHHNILDEFTEESNNEVVEHLAKLGYSVQFKKGQQIFHFYKEG